MRGTASYRWMYGLTLMICACFVFIAASLILPSVGITAQSTYVNPPAPTPELEYPGRQKVMSRAEFFEAIDRCVQNGYGAYGRGGLIGSAPRPQLTTVIVVRESRCKPKSKNRKTAAAGLFQIMPLHFPSIAQRRGISQDEVIRRIHEDPLFSTEEGIRILQGHLSRQGETGGQCGYAGEWRQYRALGWCWASRANGEYMAWLGGGETTTAANHDIDDPDNNFGNIEHSGGGMTPFTTLNCEDGTKNLAQALAKMGRAFRIASNVRADEEFFNGIENAKKTNMYRAANPPVEDAYCLRDLEAYFDTVRLLLMGAAFIDALLAPILAAMDQLCNFLIDSILVPIENWLNQFCIPFPHFSFDLDLPSINRSSCNGTSLAGVMAVAGNSITYDQLRSGVYGALSDAGLPAINTIPRYTLSSPALAEFFRRVFGTTSDGQQYAH